MKTVINDFGEKIGGARKDMYCSARLDELNDAELKDVTRVKIWKKPNIYKLLENADEDEKLLLYWKETIRKVLPLRPKLPYGCNKSAYAKAFITAVEKFKQLTETDQVDINAFKDLVNELYDKTGYYYEPKGIEGRVISSDNLVRLVSRDINWFKKVMKAEQFGLTADEKLKEKVRKDLYVIKFAGIVSENGTNTKEDVAYFLTSEEDPEVKKLHVKTWFMRGTYYVYKRSRFFDSGWDKDTYIILSRSGGVVMNGFKTKADADSYIDTIVNVSQSKKKAAKRRSSFPIQLVDVKQVNGTEITRHIEGEDYLNVFRFRGGEYGNWMNENDRQTSLDMGYIALKNLAAVLGISDEDISLGQKLAIAFGARGHSKASAHYEPARNVINLTKMKGAGALAHEWGHALDAYIGSIYGTESGSLYTEGRKKEKNPIMEEIINALKYKEETITDDVGAKYRAEKERCRTYLKRFCSRLSEEALKRADEAIETILDNPPAIIGEDENITALSDIIKKDTGRCIRKDDRNNIRWTLCNLTRLTESVKNGEVQQKSVKVKSDYLTGSEYFDKEYLSMGGYWSSTVEMFARAFDCYISDKLKEAGITDTYLTAYANSFRTTADNGTVMYAYPTGDERIRLNKLFDELIGYLKTNNMFTKRSSESKQEQISDVTQISIFDFITA